MVGLLRIGIPYRFYDAEILRVMESKGFVFEERVPRKFWVRCRRPRAMVYLLNSNVLTELVEEGRLDAAFIPSVDFTEAHTFCVPLLDLNLVVARLMLGVPNKLARLPLKDIPIDTVLTRTPRLTGEFIEKNGLKWKIKQMRGTMESLLPVFGSRCGIVEYVRTGQTMELNGITPVTTIDTASILLIAHPRNAKSPEIQKIRKMLAAHAKLPAGLGEMLPPE